MTPTEKRMVSERIYRAWARCGAISLMSFLDRAQMAAADDIQNDDELACACEAYADGFRDSVRPSQVPE